MTSSGNASDAAMKLFLAESFSKDSPHYEENVFQVRVKFKANSSFFLFIFSVQRLSMKFWKFSIEFLHHFLNQIQNHRQCYTNVINEQ